MRTRMQRMARGEGLHAAALAGWGALSGLIGLVSLPAHRQMRAPSLRRRRFFLEVLDLELKKMSNAWWDPHGHVPTPCMQLFKLAPPPPSNFCA